MTHSLKDDSTKLEVYRLSQQEHLSISEISNILGIPRTTLSDFINRKSFVDFWREMDEKPIASGTLITPEKRRKSLNKTRYVFTSAQNNTFVNKSFLESLLVYCEHNNSELIVGTYTYNKNGFQNLTKEGEVWYDPMLVPYLLNESAIVRDQVVWCGELNILPTAVNPLSGFTTYTKHWSGIIPHAKVNLQSCPVTPNSDPKFLYTTGSVTKSNYIQKKAGQQAEFHHIYGALVLEFNEEDQWFARQLLADNNGSFFDLDKLYTPTEVLENQRVEAITWGDLHSETPDLDVYKGSFASESSLLDLLKPKYQFCHDTLDFKSRNHHNIKDPYFRLRSQVNTPDRVEHDVFMAANTFKLMNRDYCKTICVESNHDLALMRWLKEADVRFDNIDNVLFYHKCQIKIINSIKEKKDKDFSIFESCINEIYPELDIQFLKQDESFITCKEFGGIENGNHGHIGVNGSRGGSASFKRVNIRTNIGHTHTAFITEGAYGSGLSGSMNQGYNKGPTTWSHSHIITYPNGKRSIITFRKEKYRA